MGQSESKKASIYVHTEKPYYFSGEIVSGNVYLNVVEAGFPGNILYLRVDGQEICKWQESHRKSYTDSDGRSKWKTEIDHYNGQNSFYSHKIQLHQFDVQYLPQGQYVFPFQFSLLSHLPGSFEQIGHGYKASIQYRVKAEVLSLDGSSIKIQHFQELVVREPLKTEVQALYGEMIVQTKTWCCIDQGKSQIRCVFDKNAYLPGDQAFLNIDIDNSDCKLDVKEIIAVLSQEIILRSNQGRQFRIPKVLVNQRIEGIPARSSAKDENRKSMMMVLQNSNYSENERQLKPSTNGDTVKSQYSLSTTAILSGCTCCAQHPSVKVPINIVAPVPIQYEQVQQAPQNWDPQTFEPVLIQFVDSDKYAKDPNVKQNFNYPSQNQNIQGLNQFNNMNQGDNQQYKHQVPNQ